MGSIFGYGITYNEWAGGFETPAGHTLKKIYPSNPHYPPVYVNCNHNKTLEKLLGKYYDPKIRLSILFAL